MQNKLIYGITGTMILVVILLIIVSLMSGGGSADQANVQGGSVSVNGTQISTSSDGTTVSGGSASVREVEYFCSDNKKIKAVIYSGGPDPRADILLIDDSSQNPSEQESRRFILKQRVSASGARYATDGDSVVFFTKDQSARIEENRQMIFKNCKLAEATGDNSGDTSNLENKSPEGQSSDNSTGN